MAKPVTIRIKKLKELQAEMKKGETALDPRRVSPVLLSALRIFHEEALRMLRSVVTRRTGELEKRQETGVGKSNTIARAWAKNKARHAHLIEYEHRLWRGGDSRKGKGHQVGVVKARPFFRPALDATRASVRRAVRLGLQKLLAESLPGKPGDATDGQ